MTIDRFTKARFEEVLAQAHPDVRWECEGFMGSSIEGEYRYFATISGHVWAHVNSSIGADGVAAEIGENSIRVWMTDYQGNPLGSKLQRWVTRVLGWEDRLTETLRKVIAIGKVLQYCERCKTVEKVFVVKKEGKNKGRLFTKCSCEHSFNFIKLEYIQDDGDQLAEETKQRITHMNQNLPSAVADPVQSGISQAQALANRSVAVLPTCPQCGIQMRLRTRKFDGKQFYGCSNYPTCHGTRELDWEARAAVVQEVKEKEFKWSEYQIAIFNTVAHLPAGSNVLVEALAGTGKTTTIAHMTKLLPRDKNIVVLVFNKHNVKPVKDKVPEWVRVRTYNSLGFKNCKMAWGRDIEVVEDKVDIILGNVLNKDTYGYLFGAIKKLVGLVKANLMGTTPEELYDLAVYHDIDMGGEEALVFQAVAAVISRCAADTKNIDYDDQCWLPIYHNVPLAQYDYVFVDEAQDTNKCQMALALGSVNSNGHIIAVGDRYQSMYGFRGADAEAIPNLIANLDPVILPLSRTYRNPECVVGLVREQFPHIPLEGVGKEGKIIHTTDQQAIVMYQAGDMVLCRTNAPLVAPVFALIRHGIKATIRGRDIGKGLTALIKKMKASDLVELLKKLDAYADAECQKLQAVDKNSQAIALRDKVETIIALSDGVYTIAELSERVEGIFSDEVEGVVFSTIHRAKGLEAERVFILHPELLPHPMAKKDWEKQQEENIQYVALTRTLSELYFVREA